VRHVSDPLNLRLARKHKRRAEKEAEAAAKRLAHGRSKGETTKAKLVSALEEKRLEMHRRAPDDKDCG
jgi:Domain of unknown function (DUF4169)